MIKGKFISIEGPDGSGKTTLINALKKELEDRQIDLITTREPGGSPIAEQIREIILDVNHTNMDYRTEALLFAAQRRQHLVEKIIPAINQGQMVITDRFVDSSMVYQGVARKLPLDLVWQINQFAIEDYMPDLTLLIDVPTDIGLNRIYKAQGKRQFDRLDQESKEFHQMVRQAFLNFAEKDPRIILVDGKQAIEKVTQECLRILEEHQII